MRILKARLRGSFTAEACILVPVITFIMIGMLFYICCMHDRAAAQSMTLRRAEAALVQQQFSGMSQGADTGEETLQEAVIMSKVQGPSAQAESFSIRTIYRSLKSYRSAAASSASSFQIPVLQTAVFTGADWDSSCKVSVTTVDYPADWLKDQIRKRQR